MRHVEWGEAVCWAAGGILPRVARVVSWSSPKSWVCTRPGSDCAYLGGIFLRQLAATLPLR